ncbi:MAG TPA: polysaccharide deacetylase family protein, partial [Terriglobales bacterium]|nr:polysaccharide deacetylase family protein [Terriglobales bacterium]
RINERQLAQEASLYLSSEQLRSLGGFDFEIGNHTYSHVHCRRLSPADYVEEIDRNKAALEAVSCTNVRAFSQPYGSSADLTPSLIAHLKGSGHQVAFLSESVANQDDSKRDIVDRINPRSADASTLFFEIEILPRLRAIRDRLRRDTSTHLNTTSVQHDGTQHLKHYSAS